MQTSTSPRILLAGATGYLGLHIVKQLQAQNIHFVALARNTQKLMAQGVTAQQIVQAEVTQASTLVGVCNGIDVVISCLGITRQRDGLSYMEVDYQANLNLLLEAERAGTRKFIYISAFNAPLYPQVRLLQAKERFATRLLQSKKLQPCVIRPNGFFSDLEEIYQMASTGKVYQFGDGSVRLNPIHGRDLAQFCLAAIPRTEQELDVGGPEVLSIEQIAQLAFRALNKPEHIVKLPDWVRRMVLWIVARLPDRWGGPAEFFLTAMSQDAVAPAYGELRLGDHYAHMAIAHNT
ncbi:SDR family oxidoreductase [Shewanella dokdonensis]|uniref:Divinyl chlorophyllide a 8-vinyl-reductase, chloroplastic n=1 Tax=Shewanella dokdonensis TaxID=712036 RepID=A0ABX8DID7_9GAMM|nr:SDR family oxidoreductase [Shewanella dokdonensis]MCL1076134.1 SDR family oxidoreductase [Shewanella dokdonensis]QVK24475.1 SDR family oxidoreductase [Shewanella dokdonensis]